MKRQIVGVVLVLVALAYFFSVLQPASAQLASPLGQLALATPAGAQALRQITVLRLATFGVGAVGVGLWWWGRYAGRPKR